MQWTSHLPGATDTAAAPRPQANRGPESLSVRRRAAQPRILIVEDAPEPAHAASSRLAATGRYEILVVRQAARAFFSARRFRPDLVLLDIARPGKGSREVKRELSEDITLGDVPILVLEENIAGGGIGWARRTRCAEIVLAKSVDRQTLLAGVEELLRQPSV